jgi:hypothetical protein
MSWLSKAALSTGHPRKSGEGRKSMELFHSGLVRLPRPIQNPIASDAFQPVGEGCRQLLDHD